MSEESPPKAAELEDADSLFVRCALAHKMLRVLLLILASFGQQAESAIGRLTAEAWSSAMSTSLPAIGACVMDSSAQAPRAIARLAAAKESAPAGQDFLFGLIDDANICGRSHDRAPVFLASVSGGESALRVPSAVVMSPAALIDFALRCARPRVAVLNAGDDIRAIVSVNTGVDGIGFLLVGGEQDAPLATAFDRVSSMLRGRASFFSVRADLVGSVVGLDAWLAQATVPIPASGGFIAALNSAVTVSVDAKVPVLAGSAGALKVVNAADLCARAAAAAVSDGLATLDFSGVAHAGVYAWVMRNRWSQLTELTPATLSDARIDGRLLVLGILGRIDADAEALARVLVSLSESSESSILPADVREKFIFSVVEKSAARSFTAQFSTTAEHEIVVIDLIKSAYWRDQSVRQEEDMETWLREIIAGVAPLTALGNTSHGARWFEAVSIGVATVAAIAAATAFFIYTRQKGSRPIFSGPKSGAATASLPAASASGAFPSSAPTVSSSESKPVINAAGLSPLSLKSATGAQSSPQSSARSRSTGMGDQFTPSKRAGGMSPRVDAPGSPSGELGYFPVARRRQTIGSAPSPASSRARSRTPLSF